MAVCLPCAHPANYYTVVAYYWLLFFASFVLYKSVTIIIKLMCCQSMSMECAVYMSTPAPAVVDEVFMAQLV